MQFESALIVDDSRTSAAILGKMLGRQHISWHQVDSGEACLEYLVSQTPDIIFMDHMMPGMDGFQAVKAIRQQPELQRIPIVMYTSRQGDLYYGQARALGAVGVLQKPATQQDLQAVLVRSERQASAVPGPAITEPGNVTGSFPSDSEAVEASATVPQSWLAVAEQARGRSSRSPAGLHRALIVDDSRTSAAVLAKMLARHELVSDQAGSGEECLTYLASANPDVIFMDHMMPGMDGFEAVRAIKQQTKLRAIPIVMYTSQSGDMYFGQARALGAVGVLKKPVSDQELVAMLARIQTELQGEVELSAGGGSLLSAGSTLSVVASAAAVPESPPGADARDTGHNELVAERSSGVITGDRGGNQSGVGGKWARSGAASYIEQGESHVRPGAVERTRDAEPVPPATAGGSRVMRGFGRFRAIAATLLVATITLSAGWLGWQRQHIGIDQRALVEALSGLANLAPEYDYDTVPFDNRRHQQLREIVSILTLAGVAADVELRAHVGEYCRVYAGPGGAVLPDANRPIESCDLIGYEPEEALRLATRQSHQFRQFVEQVNAGVSGIRVRLAPAGTFEPLLPYPPDGDITLADDWNRIAARNNRVEIRVTLTDS